VNFEEAESYLLSLGNEVETMKLGLENITALLAALGEPQNRYLKVQVAGTNGKGSVCAFLDSICVHAGIRTGLFTSPHLVSITERVRIGGEDISKTDFAKYAARVRETAERLVSDGKLERVPTYFEQVTAVALVAFAEAGVELAILETGLGGRFDATTAAEAEIAVITRIDLDHQDYLGDTIEKIAAEKAAIIREDSIVCVGAQPADVLEVIKNRCRDFGITPATLEYVRWEPNYPGVDFIMSGFTGEEVVLSLHGEHQVENAALAIRAAIELRKYFAIGRETIILGLEKAQHPGRLQELWVEGEHVLLDGAHNPGGATALTAYLRRYEPDTNIAFVFGAMKEKDLTGMLKSLLPRAAVFILSQPANSRAFPPKDALQLPLISEYKDKILIVEDASEAFDTALQRARTFTATRRKLVVVTGSLYLVGEVTRHLKSKQAI
jgi:dihydrofolate synthase / folylpolyglutamate synthase